MKEVKIINLVLFHFMSGCLFFTSSLNAQNSGDTIAYSIDIDDVVITGQYAPTHYKKAIHKVSVISAEEINQMARTQLQEVLSTIPNVRLSYDPILGTSITMRGVASDNINVLMDGVPIIGRLDGALDISQININDIERIEIIEGPLSTLYGNNAGGGVINIITKKTQSRSLMLALDAQYEAPGIHSDFAKIGYKKNNFFISGSVNYHKHQLYPLDSTRVVDVIQLDSSRTFQLKRYPWNPKKRLGYNLSTGYSFNDSHRIQYKYDISDEEVQNLGKINRPQFKPYAIDNLYSTSREDHTLLYNGMINKYFINASLAKNDFSREVQYNRIEFAFDTITTDMINSDLSYADSLDFDAIFAKIDFSSDLDGPFNFLFGANYIKEGGSGDRLFDAEQVDSTNVSLSDIALFGSVKYNLLDKLDLSFSGRLGHNSKYKNPFIPAFQFLYRPNDKLSLRLGYAHGFRAPTLKELYLNFIDTQHFVLGNENLNPEGSRDLSLSAQFDSKIDNWKIAAGVSGYYNMIHDKIILVEYEFFKFRYDNIEESTSYGTNASLNFDFGNYGFSTSAGLGFRSNTLNGLNKIAKVVDMQNEIRATLPYKINVSLQHRYVGATPKFQLQGTDVIQNTTQAYNLVDLSFSRKFFNDYCSIAMGVKNLIDVTRVDIEGESLNMGLHITSSPVQLVSQGRTAFMKISIQLAR